MRSERRLGGGRDLSEVYYALDGQFVSSWRDLQSTAGMSSVFPKPDSEIIPQGLLVAHYTTLACIPIPIVLSVVIMNKICRNRILKYRFTSSLAHQRQIFPFVCGFFICFTLFEFAVIVAELSSWNSLTSYHVTVKQIILVLICGYAFSPSFGVLPIIPCLVRDNFDKEDPTLKKVCFAGLLIIIGPIFILTPLFSAWLIISLLATILLGIAYH